MARGRGETLPALALMKPRGIVDYLQANAPPVYESRAAARSRSRRSGWACAPWARKISVVAVLIGKALIEFPPKFVMGVFAALIDPNSDATARSRAARQSSPRPARRSP